MAPAVFYALADLLPLLAILGFAVWHYGRRADGQPQSRRLRYKKRAIVIAGAGLGLGIPLSLSYLGFYLDPVTPGTYGMSIAAIPLMLMNPTYILAIFLAGRYARARFDGSEAT